MGGVVWPASWPKISVIVLISNPDLRVKQSEIWVRDYDCPYLAYLWTDQKFKN